MLYFSLNMDNNELNVWLWFILHIYVNNVIYIENKRGWLLTRLGFQHKPPGALDLFVLYILYMGRSSLLLSMAQLYIYKSKPSIHSSRILIVTLATSARSRSSVWEHRSTAVPACYFWNHRFLLCLFWNWGNLWSFLIFFIIFKRVNFNVIDVSKMITISDNCLNCRVFYLILFYYFNLNDARSIA